MASEKAMQAAQQFWFEYFDRDEVHPDDIIKLATLIDTHTATAVEEAVRPYKVLQNAVEELIHAYQHSDTTTAVEMMGPCIEAISAIKALAINALTQTTKGDKT